VGEQLLGRALLVGCEQRFPPALVGLGRVAGTAERERQRPVLRAGDVVQAFPQQKRLHGEQLGARVDEGRLVPELQRGGRMAVGEPQLVEIVDQGREA